MKKLTKQEIYYELNSILLKRRMIDVPIDFENNTFTDNFLEVVGHARILEYKIYYKNYKRPIKDLRRIYLLLEKYIQHEKRILLQYRKNLDELTKYDENYKDEDE
jgi:hypothetical protein